MRVLFAHRHMPGQFRHLAARLARDPANEVAFVTRSSSEALPRVRRIVYHRARQPRRETHRYLTAFEDAVLHGQAAARAFLTLRREGFRPDIVVAHPGWGDSLFVKDVFGAAPVLSYAEFFYRSAGADAGFDPAEAVGLDEACRIRTRGAHLLLALESCDRAISPTAWQKRLHPDAYHDKIDVVFDGIDTRIVRPDPAARFLLPNGRVLTAEDEVVTYVARNLEPYRGFPSFMRALPRLCRARPRAEIVIAGGDDVSYGARPADGRSWREVLLDEVPVDRSRVHFVGTLPYARYLRLLQVSTVHVYLTVPFVLSWSMMEALAAGCVVVGSATPPVEEVIEDGENGFLVDFFSPGEIAALVATALERRSDLGRVRRQARETVLRRYALDRCLPRQMALVRELAGMRPSPRLAASSAA